MATKKTSKTKSAKTAASKAKGSSKLSAGKKSGKNSTTKSTSQKKTSAVAKSAKPALSSRGTSTNRTSKAAASGKAGASPKTKRSKSSSTKLRVTRETPPKTNRTKDVPWEEQEELPKTKLTDKQLDEFKTLLLAKRKELTGDVRNLTQDALGRNRQDATGDLSSMPIHMADLGTDNWEQEFTLGLIANEQQLVREIDQALARIEDRTYGICMGTLKPIRLARLRAKPWAKYCIEYARQRELGRV